MNEDESIDAVVEEFRNDDSSLYAFKPYDVERFFIGEAIISAAATIFVAAFYEGVKEVLKERGESLGKTITNWVVDKLEGLFKKPKDAEKEEEKVKRDLQDFSSAASKLDTKELKNTFDSTEKIIIETMTKRGVPVDQASEIAKKVRKAAEGKISR